MSGAGVAPAPGNTLVNTTATGEVPTVTTPSLGTASGGSSLALIAWAPFVSVSMTVHVVPGGTPVMSW